MSAFSDSVYALVARIPCGKVASYGQLARMLDKPTGARAVGTAMRNCPDGLPWQRVVQSGGGIANDGWAHIRRAMLESEGVAFLPDGRVDMARCQWDGIPDGNLFMVCERLNRAALSGLPEGYSIRACRPDELDIWKAMHFDTPALAQEYRAYMDEYFANVYANAGDEFFRRCMMLCEGNAPIGTCFLWRAYGRVNTVHWFKVLPAYEGRGLGRALLSHVLRGLNDDDMPVCLHTQPGSYRAIKLYSDFGFRFITDARVGHRPNDLEMALPVLRRVMPKAAFDALGFATAPQELLDAAAACPHSEF